MWLWFCIGVLVDRYFHYRSSLRSEAFIIVSISYIARASYTLCVLAVYTVSYNYMLPVYEACTVSIVKLKFGYFLLSSLEGWTNEVSETH